MLRAFALLLVLANLLYLGYTSSWFDDMFGLHSLGDREPQRLANQVEPERVVVLPRAALPTSTATSRSARTSTSPSTSSPTAAPGPTTCLEAGPFAAVDAPAAEAALRSVLPQGGWIDVRADSASNDSAGSHLYRVESADAATAGQLRALRLDAAGRGFSPCPLDASDARTSPPSSETSR